LRTGREPEAAVLVLLPREPARRLVDTARVGCAQREDPERRVRHEARERAVGTAIAVEARNEVAPREVMCGQAGGFDHEDRSLDLPHVAYLPRAGADVVDRAVVATLDVARIAPARREAQ
jgi:hypothetical protein